MKKHSTRARKILAKLSLGSCTLAIVAVAIVAAGATAGEAEVYACERGLKINEQPESDTHEQRVLARTIEDEDSEDEWDWETSSDTSESLLDVVTD